MGTNNLTDIILEFHGRFSCFENSVVKKSGLTQAQSEILNIVSQSGTIKMKDIAEKRKISKCTLTVSIKRLEKKGFLKRVPLEKDKRVSLIQLTEKGARHLDMHHLSLYTSPSPRDATLTRIPSSA